VTLVAACCISFLAGLLVALLVMCLLPEARTIGSNDREAYRA
jgi:hypothetical protein